MPPKGWKKNSQPQAAAPAKKKGPVRIRKNDLDALKRYPWPGNVRELRNAIERATQRARKLLEEDFAGYMNHLGLPHPKLMDIAVPANLRCGQPDAVRGADYEKAAELRDYFRDDCVDQLQARITKLDSVSASTAVAWIRYVRLIWKWMCCLLRMGLHCLPVVKHNRSLP